MSIGLVRHSELSRYRLFWEFFFVGSCRLFSFFFFSSRRRHTRCSRDWSSDVCSSDLLPSVTISFDLQPNVSLGTAVAAVQLVARQVLPSSVTTSFGGTAQAFQSSQTGLVFLLILAVLVIYLVLGILYESFIHPLTILSALPFAGFGALVTLLLFRIELSVYAFVGIIMLVGLVKKNGI